MEKQELGKIQVALKNAEMSARMEGLELTPQLQKQCFEIVTGKKTWQTYVEEINEKYANA
ncbi:hypothetical protein CLNEO_19160 [Anaerotignum neopropionicum]|uniref:Antitoxin VbhA domain-containing protein n=1 Tax=Anaerotignum neopropionicum TaxID=36847 RepID=A0A136WEE4_9FIRM|nr:antitoxin VbhA family protein [Anaerotignum neopropionicum]KXL52892.1 hypothetical protein CLNEO_19160 [Anaerotignum neopropionicum]